jgi:hypothetical protein
MKKILILSSLVFLVGCTTLTRHEQNQLRELSAQGVTVDRPIGNYEKPASGVLAGALNLLPMGDVKMYMALCFLCGYKISVFVLLLSQLLLIVFHFVKRGKNGVNEIKTVSYPLAPFVLIAYIVIVILYIGGVL